MTGRFRFSRKPLAHARGSVPSHDRKGVAATIRIKICGQRPGSAGCRKGPLRAPAHGREASGANGADPFGADTRQSRYPVLRCRVPSATRPMFHKTRPTSIRSNRFSFGFFTGDAAHQAGGEARGPQAAMPLEFGKATAQRQAMPITRR
jgi:hypothetical protein